MAAPKPPPVVPRDVFTPDPIIRRPQRDIDKLSPRHFPPVAARHAKFFYGSIGAREVRTARVSRDIKAHCCRESRNRSARASIIFYRQSRSIVQIECPITRCLLSAHPPLIYRQSLAKAAEPSCVFDYSPISPSFDGARSRFSFCFELGEDSRYEATWHRANCIFPMRANCRAIGDSALCARDKQTNKPAIFARNANTSAVPSAAVNAISPVVWEKREGMC